MENQIILTKESSESDLRRYFEAILKLSESEDYPFNLDEVWRMGYSNKGNAVITLRRDFIEGVDYKAVPFAFENAKAKKGGHNKVNYFLSPSCMEYFIARKNRDVFEVYRQVFHRTAQIIGALQQQYQVPQSFSDALLLAAQQQKQIEEQQRMIEAKESENKEQRQKIEQSNETIALQEQEIKKAAPKVKYYDDVLNSNDLVTTSLIAKDLGMSAETLNRRLRDSDIQYKQGNTWILKRPYYTWNLGKLVTTPYLKSDGTQGTNDLWKWNQRGRLFINALVRCGYNVRDAIKYIKGMRQEDITVSQVQTEQNQQISIFNI